MQKVVSLCSLQQFKGALNTNFLNLTIEKNLGFKKRFGPIS